MMWDRITGIWTHKNVKMHYAYIKIGIPTLETANHQDIFPRIINKIQIIHDREKTIQFKSYTHIRCS